MINIWYFFTRYNINKIICISIIRTDLKHELFYLERALKYILEACRLSRGSPYISLLFNISFNFY